LFRDGLAIVTGGAEAIAPGAVEAQRAAASVFLQGPAGVAAARRHAVATGAVEAQRAAASVFLQGPAGVAAARRHAVATGAVVPKGASSHFREGLHGLLSERAASGKSQGG